jgi:4-amino-4-deoxy-L-arabinose transferase-like glycosyltransferase
MSILREQKANQVTEGARMIVQGLPATASDERLITRGDWLLIGLLVALVLPLRVWLICNTEVTARDSIGYIRYALQFEQYGWKETLLKNHQHPGYPVLVLLMSQPVRALDGATTPENMALSTQLVNLLASLVLIVPMYHLGRQFFARPVSFFGTLLYQYLPISAQNLSDGISEPIYLVLMTTALLQAVHAVRERSVWRCCWCGAFTGLAYLTRPEGALVLPAFVAVLVAMQIWPAWRGSWLQFCKCGLAATTSALLVGSVYFGTTGKFSNKPTVEVITHEVVCADFSPLPEGEGRNTRVNYSLPRLPPVIARRCGCSTACGPSLARSTRASTTRPAWRRCWACSGRWAPCGATPAFGCSRSMAGCTSQCWSSSPWWRPMFPTGTSPSLSCSAAFSS